MFTHWVVLTWTTWNSLEITSRRHLEETILEDDNIKWCSVLNAADKPQEVTKQA